MNGITRKKRTGEDRTERREEEKERQMEGTGKDEAAVCAKNYNLLHTASRSPKNAPSHVPFTHPLNLPPLCQAQLFAVPR